MVIPYTKKNLQKVRSPTWSGVNGGYIKNPNVRFGVNCYGKKPKITEEEEEIMKNTKPYPLSKDDVEVNKLANKYKKNLDNILLSSFNKKKWSRI